MLLSIDRNLDLLQGLVDESRIRHGWKDAAAQAEYQMSSELNCCPKEGLAL